MNFRLTRFFSRAAVVVALAVAVPVQAYNNEVIDAAPSAEAMALDLLIVRPLCVVGTVTGVVIFVLALPVNLITFNFADPARRLIVEPAQYTFTRDLGVID